MSDETDALISAGLNSDIAMTHERFVAAMASRLPTMSLAMKETYFAVLANLVGKLEDEDKPLRRILEEMMMESSALILQQMNTSD